MIRVGTRGSALAVAQAAEVASRLRHAHQYLTPDIELIPIRTTGDRIQDRPLAAIGGKGLFVREIERALLAGEIDLAVHSMKDLEPELAPGTTIAAMLPRADPHDCLVPPGRIEKLASGTRVGTSSPRRQAILKHVRLDLATVLVRGNVGTRLALLEAGAVDALVLAVAGLERLGFPAAYSRIPEDIMCPAAGQGAIGVQIRADNERLRALVDCIKDASTTAEVSAERAFVASLSATCQTPVGAYAKVSRDVIQLTTVLLSLDGTRVKWASRKGPIDRPVELGQRLGAEQVEAIEREHGGAAAFFGYGVHDGIAASPGSTG